MANKKGAARAQVKAAATKVVVPAKVAPKGEVAKPVSAAHLVAARKTGLQLSAETKLALTPYGLKQPNPWGKGKGGEPIFAALLKAGAKGMTLAALEAMCAKGGTIRLTTKATARDHIRYLWCWGHTETAYLSVDGKVCQPFAYGVRPAH